MGLIVRTQQSIPPQYHKQYNHNQTKTQTQQSIYTPNTFNEHNTTTQHRKSPIRQRALQGRHSCKAQGAMRAKPDMKPWVHADKRGQRALQGRHSCKAQGEMRAKPDMKPWVHTRPIRQRALQGRHSRKAQGAMRAKPDMKPWVNTDKSGLSSVGAALSARAFVLDRVVPPLKGLKIYSNTLNPGLAPWALQEYRPLGAHCSNAPTIPQ